MLGPQKIDEWNCILCKVTEEAKVEIELQKERRVEGFQRQVILLEIQIFV